MKTDSCLYSLQLLHLQPAGGSVAVRKHLKSSVSFHPSITSSLSLLCLSSPLSCCSLRAPSTIFPTFYSSNPSIPRSPLCVVLRDCVCMSVCALLPGGRSCAAAAGGRGIPEPAHRGTSQTDLSQTHTRAQNSHNKSPNRLRFTCSVSAGDNCEPQLFGYITQLQNLKVPFVS